jgi:hypothetical protein
MQLLFLDNFVPWSGWTVAINFEQPPGKHQGVSGGFIRRMDFLKACGVLLGRKFTDKLQISSTNILFAGVTR